MVLLRFEYGDQNNNGYNGSDGISTKYKIAIMVCQIMCSIVQRNKIIVDR